MIRGRSLFKVVKPVLSTVTFLLMITPAPVIRIIWVWLDLIPGVIGVGLRYCVARRLAASVGENVFFGRSVEVLGWDKINIGSNVSVHKDCYIDGSGGLEIGNDVSIAHATSILTFEHTWQNTDASIRSNPLEFRKVAIRNDVWIGCGCRILSGIVLNTRSVVAAGSVVNKSVCANTLVAGMPARKIKDI